MSNFHTITSKLCSGGDPSRVGVSSWQEKAYQSSTYGARTRRDRGAAGEGARIGAGIGAGISAGIGARIGAGIADRRRDWRAEGVDYLALITKSIKQMRRGARRRW
jgi:hypothetical protein